MQRFSIGMMATGEGPEAAIVIDDEAIRLGSLLAATGAPPAPAGLNLSAMLDAWSDWLPRLKAAADAFAADGSIRGRCSVDATSAVTWLPPISSPRKLICMGTNYAAHASEVSSDPLKAPFSFIKSTSNTLRGSGETIELLDIAQMNDWEIELAVVIGRPARRVAEADALSFVAGYTIVNDVSARDWVASSPKFLGIDWVVGKSIDGYAPMGPTFWPAEFVTDPQNLDMELTVNGKVMQRGNTNQMLFGIAQIIAHLSKTMTLEPGDIIASGTPEGTGFGHKPMVFLQDGDVVRCTIEGLGTLENTFVR